MEGYTKRFLNNTAITNINSKLITRIIKNKSMDIRTQPNYNRKTREEVFGISIRINGGRRYCKYPIGHQNYKTIGDAYAASVEIMKRILAGARIEYGVGGSAGIDKNEYVKIVD